MHFFVAKITVMTYSYVCHLRNVRQNCYAHSE